MTYPTAHSHDRPTIFDVRQLRIYYRQQCLVDTLNLTIPENQIVALIGPSGSGKSLFLRCLNRLTDMMPPLRVTGHIFYRGRNLYDSGQDVACIRRQIGMIFERPHLFPKSIYDNVAFGARVNGYAGNMDELVERSLQQVHLWPEVKDRLSHNAMALPLGQQQQLCLARAIAVNPTVLLLDDPTLNLDALASRRLEALFSELKHRYTLIIATHDLQQAARLSDYTAFFHLKTDTGDQAVGYLVEYAETRALFQRPQQSLTYNYVTGRWDDLDDCPVAPPITAGDN
ncbi:phosphate ABC transporter ATP-binding protein [Thermosynechococcaceae cyanobacterium Okahandja]